jgi:hypothetical protein
MTLTPASMALHVWKRSDYWRGKARVLSGKKSRCVLDSRIFQRTDKSRTIVVSKLFNSGLPASLPQRRWQDQQYHAVFRRQQHLHLPSRTCSQGVGVMPIEANIPQRLLALRGFLVPYSLSPHFFGPRGLRHWFWAHPLLHAPFLHFLHPGARRRRH